MLSLATSPAVVMFALDGMENKPSCEFEEVSEEMEPFPSHICRWADTYQFSRVFGCPCMRKLSWCVSLRRWPRNGVKSIGYPGRSKVRCPTMGRQKPGQTPPVKTTSNGETTPTTSSSMYTTISLNVPCPKRETFQAANVSTYSSGVFEYQNSSSPLPLAKTSSTTRDELLAIYTDVDELSCGRLK